MKKYKNKTLLYMGKTCQIIFRADVYKHPFTGEYKINNNSVAHALTDYTDKIRTVAEDLKEGDEWYMVWTNGATEGEVWK